MARLFDVYIVVDWSARTLPSPVRPTRDALWVGEKLAADVVDENPPQETYWRTRSACRSFLRERLAHHIQARHRVLLGFDFALGYPTGFAAALGLSKELPPWQVTWQEITRCITDDEQNKNNRFEVATAFNARCGRPEPGPFWGCPTRNSTALLERTSPIAGYPYRVHKELAIERLRHTDRREPGVQAVWKLLGSGSVGGQSLVGIPTVQELRRDPSFARFSKIWPFETGFTHTSLTDKGPAILCAEMWPGIVASAFDLSMPIRDQAQVRAFTDWLQAMDNQGRLQELFALPEDLTTQAQRECIEEEGWILGSGTRIVPS